MALGLDDVFEAKQKRKKLHSESDRSPLRPWKGVQDLDNETRTYAAKEAVRKAREKVVENESFARAICAGHVDEKTMTEITERYQQRVALLSREELSKEIRSEKNRSRWNLRTFLREMFRAREN